MATKVSTPMLQPDTQFGLVPPGAVMSFAMSAAPMGWLPCDGAAINRTTYAPLFSAIGYTHGGSGNSFNVPDLRGEFIRGWAAGRSVGGQSTRTFGSTEGDAIRNITGSLSGVRGASSEAYNWGFRPGVTGAISVVKDLTPYNVYAGAYNPVGGSGSVADFDASLIVPTAADNRPRNIALLYCIKF